MTESLLIDAIGTVVAIDLEGLDSADAAAVREAWCDALAPEGATPVASVTPRNGGGRASMLMALSQQVTLAALEARSGQLWLVHAAGLALADGSVVMLIGPSGRGKTTASRALAKQFSYVSDESIGVASDGTVHAYRKPLSIIEEARRPKVERAPSRVGLMPLPTAQLHLAAIVLLDRRADGPTEPTVQVLDLGEALEDLVSQSSQLPEMVDPLWTIGAHADRSGGVVRVAYREAESLAPIIESLARRTAIATVSRVRTMPANPGAPGAPTYARCAVLDSISLDASAGIAVLTRGSDGFSTVRVLAGIAPTIWRAASGVDLDTLLAAVIAEHGEPAGVDARDAVAAAVEELVTAGVLSASVPQGQPTL